MFSNDITASLMGRLWDAEIISILSPSDSNPTFKFQVRIPPLHVGIADDDLPYAILSKRLFVGASAGVGWSSCPRVGSKVKVMFDGGTDMSLLIVAEPNGKQQLVTGFSAEDYGYVDQHSNILKVNAAGDFSYTTAKNVTITANGGTVTVVANGAQLQIDANGAVTVNAPATITMTAPTVKVDGDFIVTGTSTMQGATTMQNGADISGGATIDSATIAGLSFSSHVHGGVMSGGSSTLPPS